MQSFSYITLPSFVCLFWTIILATRWKKNYRSQNIFILNAMAMSVCFYIWNLYVGGLSDFSLYYKIDTIEPIFTLSINPLTYIYFKSLTSERPLRWQDFLWLLPGILVSIGSLIPVCIMGEENATSFMKELIGTHNHLKIHTEPVYQVYAFVSVHLYNWVLMPQIIYTIVYAIRALIRYKRRLKDFYSNLDSKSIENSYAVLIGYIASSLIFLVVYFLEIQYLDKNAAIIQILAIAWGSTLNYIGYQVATLKYTADKFHSDLAYADQEAIEQGYEFPEESNSTENKESNTHDSRVSQYIERFNELIDKQQIYLQKDLRLDDVARLMHTNRTYISRMLNEEYNCSFSDYINQCRITYAQHLMNSDPNAKQETVALQSGFSHVTSFSRTFKKLVGMTPKEWLNSL